MDYGCFFLFKDSAKSNLQLLNTLQYKALLACSGAMKGTSLSNLLSECGETSLSHRRYEFFEKFLARIKHSSKSPFSAIFEEKKFITLNKKLKSSELISYTKTIKDCNIRIEDININHKFNPPWSLPLQCVDMSLYDSIKSIHDITSKHEITDKHIENVYKHYIRIFVDGSRDDQQSCGISLIIPSMNIKIASKVNSLFSATTVEQISIYYANSWFASPICAGSQHNISLPLCVEIKCWILLHKATLCCFIGQFAVVSIDVRAFKQSENITAGLKFREIAKSMA